MSFLQRELDALSDLLRNTTNDAPDSAAVYAAHQAIAWALDPDAFASPTAMLLRYRGQENGGTKGTGVSPASPIPN